MDLERDIDKAVDTIVWALKRNARKVIKKTRSRIKKSLHRASAMRRKVKLEDIAILTGGRRISELLGT